MTWEGMLCALCGDALEEAHERVHPECLDEWQRAIEARTCFVCAEPLDDDQPDHAIHPGCVADQWKVAPDPFLRPVDDVQLPPESS